MRLSHYKGMVLSGAKFLCNRCFSYAPSSFYEKSIAGSIVAFPIKDLAVILPPENRFFCHGKPLHHEISNSAAMLYHEIAVIINGIYHEISCIFALNKPNYLIKRFLLIDYLDRVIIPKSIILKGVIQWRNSKILGKHSPNCAKKKTYFKVKSQRCWKSVEYP